MSGGMAPAGSARMRPDLLIVGAGPVGLSLALFALRAGLAPRIVDRAPGPSQHSKAVGLQYRVSELLACLGLADRFKAAGTSPGLVNMYAGRERLLSVAFADFSALAGRGAFVPAAIMIPQSETERLLGEALREQGCAVEWNTALAGLRQDAASVIATLCGAGGETEEVSVPWLAGCDGAHSSVRKLAGLGFAGKSYPLSFAIADVESAWPEDHGSVHVWFHRDGSAAAMPLPGRRRWRLFVETTQQLAGNAAAPEIDSAELRRMMRARTGNGDADIGRCLWRSDFRINCRMVDRFRAGRVFVAGDAAHIHSPTGGQGITTGIQDAANLAWKLARVRDGAPDSLLDTYGEERHAHARAVLAETDRNTRVFVAPTPWLRFLRDRLVLPLLRRPGVQRRLVRKLSQLDMNHRESPLSQHRDAGRPRAALRAGDRAPDIRFAQARGGADLRLFDLLGRGRLAALLGAGVPPETASAAARALDSLGVATHTVAGQRVRGAAGAVLVDAEGEFARLFGLEGDFLCIVRPDGYVGLIQRPLALAPLRDWLGRVSSPSAVAAAFA